MSSEQLFLDPFAPMPDIPHMNHTLLFIQTDRYLPINSQPHLQQRVPEQWEGFLDSDISIDLPLRHTPQQTAISTHTLKKKKTGCVCRKTKCLKLYCECFSTGKTCTEDCSCHDCCNDHDHTAQILQTHETLKAKTTHHAKNNHGKSCNCKKSQCRKKYCECFNAGLPCGTECRCEDCANNSHQHHPHPLLANQLNNPQNVNYPQLAT